MSLSFATHQLIAPEIPHVHALGMPDVRFKPRVFHLSACVRLKSELGPPLLSAFGRNRVSRWVLAAQTLGERKRKKKEKRSGTITQSRKKCVTGAHSVRGEVTNLSLCCASQPSRKPVNIVAHCTTPQVPRQLLEDAVTSSQVLNRLLELTDFMSAGLHMS